MIIYIGQINNCENDLNFCELLEEQITNIIIYVYSVYDVLMLMNVHAKMEKLLFMAVHLVLKINTSIKTNQRPLA